MSELPEITNLKRWRSHGDGPETYTAGSKQFGGDVIVLLIEYERLRALIEDGCKVFEHYDLPEHAFHYRRALLSKHDRRQGIMDAQKAMREADPRPAEEIVREMRDDWPAPAPERQG